MVNKIPAELDNPIDTIIYNHIDEQLDLFKNLKLTPNLITTISLICGLGSVYNVYKNNYIIGAILWFLSYYFDCADGKMARKFKMTSKFGDVYDHTSDIIKHLLLFYVLYNKLNSVNSQLKLTAIIILFIIIILTCAQIGCQEKLNKTDSAMLSFTTKFIFCDCKTQMKYTRYFSPATLTLYLILIMLLLNEYE